VTYSNFTNGALVMRVWKFDGDTELLAKFQYWDQAEMFAQSMLDRDLIRRDETDSAKKPLGYFYISICENECRVRAFGTKEEKAA
jgi:hypothetical protein